MREILFRGKTDKGEWMQGSLIKRNIGCFIVDENNKCALRKATENLFDFESNLVNCGTIGQHTGLTDKNGKKIFEGDIVQYINSDDFDCQSIVKFGEYKQDGSGGEYGARKCLGFYVDVDNFTCPDWCEDDPEYFPRHMWQQNILEVVDGCEIIGNIYDNLELLSKRV